MRLQQEERLDQLAVRAMKAGAVEFLQTIPLGLVRPVALKEPPARTDPVPRKPAQVRLKVVVQNVPAAPAAWAETQLHPAAESSFRRMGFRNLDVAMQTPCAR
jgi:hypothetical protein